MNYKNLSRTLRKYNEDDLLLRVSDIHRKSTATGAGFYMPTAEVLRYIAAAYLKRLFRLQQIRDLCISTAHVIMGQLELGHWEKFSLFIVALCADINNGIRSQVSSMESAYNGLAKCIRSLDARFPETLAELSIFPTLRGHVSAQKNVDTARVMRLLQMSDEQLDAVRTRDQMALFREEALSSIESKKDSVDMGVTIEREERIEEIVPIFKGARKPSSSDSGLDLDADISPWKDEPDERSNVVGEQQLLDEGSHKPLKKSKRKRKSKKSSAPVIAENSCASASLIDETTTAIDDSSVNGSVVKRKKLKKRKLLFNQEEVDDLPLTPLSKSPEISSLLDSRTKTKMKKRKKLLIKGKETAASLLTPVSLSSQETDTEVLRTEIKKKKKKKKDSVSRNILSTNFDVSTEIDCSMVNLASDDLPFESPKKLKREKRADRILVKRKSTDSSGVFDFEKSCSKKKKRKF